MALRCESAEGVSNGCKPIQRRPHPTSRNYSCRTLNSVLLDGHDSATALLAALQRSQPARWASSLLCQTSSSDLPTGGGLGSITQNCVAVVQAFYVSWLTIIPCLHLAVRYSLLTTPPRLAALGRRSIHVRCHCRAPRRDQCRRHASQITQILRSQETSSLSSHRRHVALSSVGRGDHTLRCAWLADEAVVKRHRRLVSENLAVLT